MSKITLEPNQSGAGTFSIQSPDSNSNRVLTLPDEEGIVVTNNGAVFLGSISTPEIVLSSAPITISGGTGTFSSSTNSFNVIETFTAPPAGVWKISIFAAITSSVNGKIAVFYNNGSAFGANSGYTNDTNSLFYEEIVELDGINDVTFEGARNDDGGSTTMKGLEFFGVKIG